MNIGLDVHKRMCYYTMIDNNGKIFDAGKCRTTKICIEDFSKIMPPGSKVAVEASTSGLFVYEQLEAHDVDVHLAHPAEVRPFAKKYAKTDDIDAEVLAELLYMDHLPEAHVPPSELRDVRVTVRHRGSLVKMQTRVKNRIHALLTQEGIQTPKVSDLFGKRGLEFLKGVDLRKPRKEALDNYLMVLELLARLIKMTSNGLMEKANDSEQAGWAMSVPGVGYYSALLILSEVGDVSRFSKPKVPDMLCRAGTKG